VLRHCKPRAFLLENVPGKRRLFLDLVFVWIWVHFVSFRFFSFHFFVFSFFFFFWFRFFSFEF
jgi:hypothetical protein